MPEVRQRLRCFTLRIRPGIFFADDPAFGGKPRELIAQDYVYALKRFIDPKVKQPDLWLFESEASLGLTRCASGALKTRKQPFDYDAPVDGLQALDRYTLRIELERAATTLL